MCNLYSVNKGRQAILDLARLLLGYFINPAPVFALRVARSILILFRL